MNQPFITQTLKNLEEALEMVGTVNKEDGPTPNQVRFILKVIKLSRLLVADELLRTLLKEEGGEITHWYLTAEFKNKDRHELTLSKEEQSFEEENEPVTLIRRRS